MTYLETGFSLTWLAVTFSLDLLNFNHGHLSRVAMCPLVISILNPTNTIFEVIFNRTFIHNSTDVCHTAEKVLRAVCLLLAEYLIMEVN